MLEEAAALKIVLTHGAGEAPERGGWHGVRPAEFAKGHVKGVFIAMNKPVKKVAVFVVPEA